MTLGDLIRTEGRTQEWVRTKLEEEGIKRNKSHFNQWCNDHHTPKDEYIIRVIAHILGVPTEKVENCFTKYK
jgi:hypothetical protein